MLHSTLGVLIAAASYMDPGRINSLPSAHSWVLWLIQGGETAAAEWLSHPVVRESLAGYAQTSVRSHGGRRPGVRPLQFNDTYRPTEDLEDLPGLRPLAADGLEGGPPNTFDNLAPLTADGPDAPTDEELANLFPPTEDGLVPGDDDADELNALLADYQPPSPLPDAVLAERVSTELHTLPNLRKLLQDGATLEGLVRFGYSMSVLAKQFNAVQLRDAGARIEDMINDVEDLPDAFNMDELDDLGYFDT